MIGITELIEILAFLISLSFSIIILSRFWITLDLKKFVMGISFLIGGVSTASAFLCNSINTLCYLKYSASLVIPLGLLAAALMILTRYEKQIALLFSLGVILSLVLPHNEYKLLRILFSFSSALAAAALFLITYLKTHEKKLLYLILSIAFFTISPVFYLTGLGFFIHYLFIILGLSIMFVIFLK